MVLLHASSRFANRAVLTLKRAEKETELSSLLALIFCSFTSSGKAGCPILFFSTGPASNILSFYIVLVPARPIANYIFWGGYSK